jgi:uncharacterized protein (TIRG00374 family)
MNTITISKKKLLSYLILLITLSFAIYALSNQEEVLKRLTEINIWQFLVLSVLVLITGFINGLRVQLLTKQFGVDIDKRESFIVATITTFWNYLPFTGGLAVRAVYLKKKHRFSYTNFISTTSASYVVSFLSFGLVGLFAVILVWRSEEIVNYWVVLILLSTILFSLFLFKFNFKLGFNKGLLGMVSKVIEEWKILRTRRDLLVNLFILDIALLTSLALRLFFAGQFLGFDVTLLGTLIISSLTLYAVLINITPGALVIKEAIISFGALALDYDASVGLTIAILDRAVSLFWVFSLGVIFTFFIVRPHLKKDVKN